MNFVYLMDPLETVIMEKDTTFILMLGAHRKGHHVYYLANGGIQFKNGILQFKVRQVTPQEDKACPFIQGETKILSDSDVDAVFIRTDPPFNNQYLLNTWMLDLLAEKTFVMNHPAGIRNANEKLWATQFTSFIPRTFVGRHKESLLEFLSEEKEVIAKPTDGFGGQSIFHIKADDINANVILETLTGNESREIILQQYISESKVGDKRILLLDGEPIGAVLRVHSSNDHRNNFFSGGKPQKTEITVREHEIIKVLKPKLKEFGLHFVGIDVIGEYLIEVNVTSPTCLQEINRLNSEQLEDLVIEFVEKSVDQMNSEVKITS